MPASITSLEAAFSEALEIAAGPGRDEYLDRACAGDAELRRQVESLLALHDRGPRFLESPTVSYASEPAEPVGSSIGPYKLMEQIGEGGMGVVYVAEQHEPVRRRVALKVIKPGMDSRQVVARFEAERQALALMDHPNIARVIDGGSTPEGRPYFVMELVRGIPITDYCDREQLTITERLELFVLVCRAVQHAHQKGIIHRDLKPSNILVTVGDGVAVPKVIDFGVAKATGSEICDRTVYTGFHQFVGTPLYMSPEQADLAGVDVDTRSDIYSLGVLLYELLTGSTPFNRETLKQAAFDEMRRIIREEEPPRPSTRLATPGEALTTASARRKADPRRLGPSMRGELDWMVMKALEKDRRRRYETANDFASDVMRYLTDQPVEACPPSSAYRLRKFGRRNRRFLATATVIVGALVAATSVSVWQAGLARKSQRRATSEAAIARQAQRKAEAAEARAATEAAIARAVNDFLQADLLGQADALPQLGQEVGGNPHLTVREALDRASARIGSRFRDQPLVEAAIRTTIGAAYNRLGERRRAVIHLERAVALRRFHLGPDHPDTVGSMESLTASYLWAGRVPDAIALRRQILARREAILGPNHPDTLACKVGVAAALTTAGRWDVSTSLLEDLLEKEWTDSGQTHLIMLESMYLLAMNYGETGRIAESMAVYEKLLELSRATNDPQRQRTFSVLDAFVQVCQRAGELDRAAQLNSEAIRIVRNQDDSSRRRVRLGSVHGWQALNLLLKEEYVAAEPLAREAVAAYEKYLPEDTRRFFWMSVLGAALCGQGRYDQAEPLLLRGYEEMERREAFMPARERRRITEAGEWLVHFYESTQQPHKSRAWLERLSVAHRPE